MDKNQREQIKWDGKRANAIISPDNVQILLINFLTQFYRFFSGDRCWPCLKT